jgi:tetratricopeptide (TPR) repeat protein
MPFCHNCGSPLLGNENFCPKCGANLQQKMAKVGGRRENNNNHSIGIHGTGGDVFGTGFTGSGNIIGKEIGYTVNGNVINLHITGSVSNEDLYNLQKILSMSTHIEQPSDRNNKTDKDFESKVEDSNIAHQQIKNVLDGVTKIEEDSGTNIEEIKVGELQISKNELSLKEFLLKGNERYYKQDYEEAIKWYNKALESDVNNPEAWFDKGLALGEQKKYGEEIECYDKALEIKSDYTNAWINKRSLA